MTALKSSAPVVPVRVFGTYEAYGRHKVQPRSRKVGVCYGKPLMFEVLRAEANTRTKPRLKQIYQEAANEIMKAIAELEPPVDRSGALIRAGTS